MTNLVYLTSLLVAGLIWFQSSCSQVGLSFASPLSLRGYPVLVGGLVYTGQNGGPAKIEAASRENWTLDSLFLTSQLGISSVVPPPRIYCGLVYTPNLHLAITVFTSAPIKIRVDGEMINTNYDY